jgi:hypothetical protein
MTLLDEYQALPGEPLVPDPHHVPALRFEAIERRWHLDRATRRDAVIRLLCRALHRYAGTCDDVHHNASQRHGAYDPCPVEQDIQALLTAVERDFPEGA